jgi:hypothetical protein
MNFKFLKLVKYTRLTKEQFEELTQEFSTFLATQTIDKAEWDTIKAENRELRKNWMFSDLVWENVLEAEYLNISQYLQVSTRIL